MNPEDIRRDCAIDAMVTRLVTLIDPTLCSAQIQERGSMHMGYQEYTLLFDDKAFAHVKLESPHKFTVTLL